MSAKARVASSQRSVSRNGNSSAATNSQANEPFSGSDQEKRSSGRQKKSPKSTKEVDAAPMESLYEENEVTHAHDSEHELHRQLYDSLWDCSRQRMRLLRMSLRRYGTSESRISTKELVQALQENNINVPSRTLKLLTSIFEDQHGVDYEKMWKSMVVAQSKTGRDSVMAQNKRNDLLTEPRIMNHEQRDADLLSRLQTQFKNARTSYDLPKLSNALKSKDSNGAGTLIKNDVMDIVSESSLPVYGALLNSLLSRCDAEHSGNVSWPELMHFFEKAHCSVTGETEKLTPSNDEDAQSRSPSALSPTSPASGGRPTASSTGRPVIRARTAMGNRNRQRLASKSATQGRPDAAGSRDGTKSAVSVTIAAPTVDTPWDGSKPASTGLTETSQESSSTPRDDGYPKTQKYPGKIPDPVAKEMIKSGFKKVVDGETNPGTNPSSRSASTDGVAVELRESDSHTSPVASGKRKDDTVPVIQVDGATCDIKESTGQASPALVRSQSPQMRTPTTPLKGSKPGVVEANIRGKEFTFYRPLDFSEQSLNSDPPKERLKLEWVYGYRGNDCRSNIRVLKSGEVAYFVGTVVVLYNADQHYQRHYREHTQHVRSLAVHANGVLIATGQGGKPHATNADDKTTIRLWRSDTMQTVHVLGSGVLMDVVISLSFSKTQNYLCAVDSREGHFLTVWDVDEAKLVAKSSLELEVVCDIDTSPSQPDQVVVVGKEHLGWWTISSGNSSTVQLLRAAEYQNYLRGEFVICLLHNDRGDLITGDSNGTVYVWGRGGNVITNIVKHAHDGPVFSLLLTRGTLMTSGRDGVINGYAWGKNMDMTGQLKIPKSEGGVRMLTLHREHVLVGTTSNSILMTKLAGHALRNPMSGVKLDEKALTQGHFDVLRGVGVPDDPEKPDLILTAALDGVVCLFDTQLRQTVWKMVLKNVRPLCCDINTMDNLLALGTKDTIFVYAVETNEDGHTCFRELYKGRVAKERLSTVKLAPDCQSLVAGDIGGSLYVVGVQENEQADEYWDVLAQWKGHNATVTALDWSRDMYEDTYIIRSTSADPELCTWNSDTGEAIKKPDELRGMTWISNHCTLDYGKTGLWHSKQAGEASITCVDISPDAQLAVMGDSRGYISVFRHPCVQKGAYSHVYKSHQEVVRVVFTNTGSRVVSIGGEDCAIMQWLCQ